MNTLKSIRSELNLTQDQLAGLSDTTRHSVIRMEQLCYPQPLPSIVTAISELTGLTPEAIETQYFADVERNRIATGLLLEPHYETLTAVASLLAAPVVTSTTSSIAVSGIHPFETWRIHACDLLGVSSSQIHFSIMTSIHPATLFKYEAFKTGFPLPIKVALTHIGLPPTLIEIFSSSAAFNTIH